MADDTPAGITSLTDYRLLGNSGTRPHGDTLWVGIRLMISLISVRRPPRLSNLPGHHDLWQGKRAVRVLALTLLPFDFFLRGAG